MRGALEGRRIVNTRPVHQAGALDDLIRARGAIPVSYPCIAIRPPEDTAPLDNAIKQLVEGRFDWLVITSANTVLSLSQRLQVLKLTLPTHPPFKVAVVGPSTAEFAKSQLGLTADLIPDDYVAEALADAIGPRSGMRVLLPESAIARPTLADILTAGGADVCVVEAYRTICGEGGVDLPRLFAEKQVDAITFTSSSTVECFVERMQDEGGDIADLSAVLIVCIGPKTAATAQVHHLDVAIVPETYTLHAMLDALEQHLLKLTLGI